ncbi:MAG: NYN domain-containing protein [Terriglobia bacterium]
MYLIDGNNLMGHTGSRANRPSEMDRQSVLNRVADFLEKTGRKAILVFDGSRSPLRKTSRVHLEFAGPRQKADDVIRHQIEHSRSRKDLIVVSSDNGIYGYARSCGVRALKCHEFNRLLQETPEKNVDENRHIPVADTKEWLRYFGEEE